MATNLPFCFYSIFRTTSEVSSKLYFVEICYVSEKLWLFNHKKADFWLPNFGFKSSLLSLLKIHQKCSGTWYYCLCRQTSRKAWFYMIVTRSWNRAIWVCLKQGAQKVQDKNRPLIAVSGNVNHRVTDSVIQVIPDHGNCQRPRLFKSYLLELE